MFKRLGTDSRKLLICLYVSFSLSVSGQNSEITLLQKINGTPNTGWDKAMRDLSFSVYLIEPVPPVTISLHGYFNKDKEMMWNGYKSAISLCAALAISTGLKYSIARDRPFVRHPGLIDGRDDPHTPSFPSGHTTAAFATATSLSLTYRKWYVVAPAYAYAAMAAYARMRLGVHYPTDVVGGIILGTGTSLLTWHLHKRLRQGKEVMRRPD